jgi:hypothetical protein
MGVVDAVSGWVGASGIASSTRLQSLPVQLSLRQLLPSGPLALEAMGILYKVFNAYNVGLCCVRSFFAWSLHSMPPVCVRGEKIVAF